MEDQQAQSPGESEWIDMNMLEAGFIENQNPLPILTRERSLFLAAIGLSQADSQQRKRFRSGLVPRRHLFTDLPREVRDMFHSYMAFPPLENEDDINDGHSARNLALTCRQAKREWDEESNRRFWVYLTYVQRSHLSETGGELLFSPELTAKHDMEGVESLKSIVNGPLPQSSEDTPEAFSLLYDLPLKELGIHYEGKTHELTSFSVVKSAFLSICMDADDYNIKPEHITISWNWQEQPVTTHLSGWTFELGEADKRGIRLLRDENPKRTKTSWPTFEILFSHDMRVGSMRLAQGSKDDAAQEGLSFLIDLYNAFDGMSLEGFGTMKTFEIEATYVVDEAE